MAAGTRTIFRIKNISRSTSSVAAALDLAQQKCLPLGHNLPLRDRGLRGLRRLAEELKLTGFRTTLGPDYRIVVRLTKRIAKYELWVGKVNSLNPLVKEVN